MTAATTKIYPRAVNHGIDLKTASLKVLLLTSTYVYSNAHEYLSDLTGELAAGGGYTTGGVAVANVRETDDGITFTYTADNPKFAALTASGIRHAVIYVATGVATTSVLLSDTQFPADLTSSGTDFVLNLTTGGFYKRTSS